MAAIHVEPGAVEQLAEELAGITSALAEASAVLGRTGAGASGEPGLVRSLEELADAWRDGLARLAGEARGAAEGLREAAVGYRRVEVAVAQSCR